MGTRKSPRQDKFWTSDKVERLMALVAGGEHSASMIAEEVGAVSRGAVLGYLFRAGVKLVKKSIEPPPPKTLSRKPRKKTAASPEPLETSVEPDGSEEKEADIGRGKRIWELEKIHCKYVFGDPKRFESVYYCGEPIKPGISYCQDHYKIVYENNPRSYEKPASGS